MVDSVKVVLVVVCFGVRIADGAVGVQFEKTQHKHPVYLLGRKLIADSRVFKQASTEKADVIMIHKVVAFVRVERELWDNEQFAG